MVLLLLCYADFFAQSIGDGDVFAFFLQEPFIIEI